MVERLTLKSVVDLTFKQELAPAEKAMLLGSVMLLDYSAYE